jgi:transketolase
LLELGRQNRNIVALDADLAKSTQTCHLGQECPDRFFDCGIAEQNMMGIAAGLAASGKIPFASTFAVFATSRCFDQLRMSIAYPHLNVKVVASHGGITVGEDGASHHGIEDIALACALPGMTVVVPADAIEAEQVIRAAAETQGPFYIRCGRPRVPLVHTPDYQFQLGKAALLRPGNDMTIVGCGIMVSVALDAAEHLSHEGIDCRVLNMATVKPMDKAAVLRAAEETGAIVTAEEHLRQGGLGSQVAQLVAEQHPVPLALVAINDTYAESGKAEELMRKYGLSAEHVEQAVRSVIRRKVGLL